VGPADGIVMNRKPGGAGAIASGRSDVRSVIVPATVSAFRSITVSVPSSSLATYARIPALSIATPAGARPNRQRRLYRVVREIEDADRVVIGVDHNSLGGAG